MFSLEKGRQRGDFVVVYHWVMGGNREDEVRLFLEMHRHKPEHRKILLDEGKNFTTMVVKY